MRLLDCQQPVKLEEAEGALAGDFQRFEAGIASNREFPNYLRNRGKFFCAEVKRSSRKANSERGSAA